METSKAKKGEERVEGAVCSGEGRRPHWGERRERDGGREREVEREGERKKKDEERRRRERKRKRPDLSLEAGYHLIL